MPEVLATHKPEYKVSEISQAIKQSVEDRFGYVCVRGEISGWKIPSSGHAYFRLKDDAAVLDAVCWRGTVGKLSFKPEDGLEVVVSGRITTYPGKSSYQIIAERIEPAGVGALMALLEERKKKLAAEGLFDEKRKKPLPFLPQTIGVITSPTGAVIRDILHRISERCGVHVLVWPVAVQGEGAAEQIAAAIAGFNKLLPCAPTDAHMERSSGLARSTDLAHRPDVLIVARGGGSIEDLWAFNEEIVVRAAANSAIPIISAVGHETDTTLIDFAADRRAPTPTAAAEMAVPVHAELSVLMQKLGLRLTEAVTRALATKQERVAALARALPKLSQALDYNTQKLDDLSERLRGGLPLLIARKTDKLTHISARLSPNLLMQRVQTLHERLAQYAERMSKQPERYFTRASERVALNARLLESMNVTHVLKRGFVLARDENGKPITSATHASGELSLQWHDGKATAQILPRHQT
jgi:exodeoxyribonuclease VII large subunit